MEFRFGKTDECLSAPRATPAQEGATRYQPAERTDTTDVAAFGGMTLSPLARPPLHAGPLPETLCHARLAVDAILIQCG